jgi:hypothetical protein
MQKSTKDSTISELSRYGDMRLTNPDIKKRIPAG